MAKIKFRPSKGAFNFNYYVGMIWCFFEPPSYLRNRRLVG